MPRYAGRMKRIKAKNPSMSGKQVKRLAQKRANAYAIRQSRTGLNNPGKKGSLKRAVFRSGTRADAARLKAQDKKTRKTINSNAKIMNRIAKKRGEYSTKQGQRLGELRRVSRSRARKAAPAKPKLQTAVQSLVKKAAGVSSPRKPRML